MASVRYRKSIRNRRHGEGKNEILKTIPDHTDNFLRGRNPAPAAAPAGSCRHLWHSALVRPVKNGYSPLASVRETACFLVEIMPVMFIPAAVGIMDSWGIIAPSWLEYLTMTVVSTVIVMAVSGLVTQTVLRVRSREVLQEPLQTHSQEPLQTSMYQAGAERKALPEEANADTDAPVPKKEEQSHE